MDFHGKVVLITGASSGIGAGAAELFAKRGAQLALVGRNENNLKETLAKCAKPSKDPDHLIIIADVSKDEDLHRIIDLTIKHFGKLDILINNAGILVTGGIEDINMEEYDSVMNVNVRAVVQLTKLAIPYLIITQGNIVNVSSVAGTRSFTGLLSYCMSKSAIDQFTKCASLELAPKNVRVNAVNPGVIITDIHRRAGMDENAYKEFLEYGKTTHALGRVGEVNEVAEAIAYLASDAASFTTGANLPVCGGRHVMCPR